MRGFDDVLKEGFDRHARALGVRGGILSARDRVVGAIRRRRRVRVGVTGAASMVAVGALAGGVFVALPHLLDRDAVGPGSYPWCEFKSHPLPNLDAFTEYAPYEGRVYADYATNEYVFVVSDGTQERLAPDSSGSIQIELSDGFGLGVLSPEGFPGSIPSDQSYYDIWNSIGDEGVTVGHTTLPDPEGLRLAYEWTTEVPDVIPSGVAIEDLIETHLPSLGFPGSGLNASAVPPGAVVQTVVRWTDGREEVSDIAVGDMVPLVGSFAGLESVTTRVTDLPGGEVFEIVSTYDSSMTWSVACLGVGDLETPEPSPSPMPEPSMSPSPSPSPGPSTPLDESDIHWGPYLEGPEQEAYQCLVALPVDAEDRIPATVETHVGELYVEKFGESFDFKSGGVVVKTSYEQWVMEDISSPQYLGWMSQRSGSDDGSERGLVTFDALAWVDEDGVIIGREEFWEEDMESGAIRGFGGWEEGDDGRMNMTAGRFDLASRGKPCDGVDPAALQGASIVFLHGAGPSADEMTWSWTRLTESS